jgi:hypothetical protein
LVLFGEVPQLSIGVSGHANPSSLDR